jgi:hypothetical protein
MAVESCHHQPQTNVRYGIDRNAILLQLFFCVHMYAILSNIIGIGTHIQLFATEMNKCCCWPAVQSEASCLIQILDLLMILRSPFHLIVTSSHHYSGAAGIV